MAGFVRRQLLLGALAWAAGAAHARRPAPGPYVGRPDVREFVDGVASEYGVPRAWAERVLATGRRSAQAERLMTPTLTPPPRDWTRYRARALDESRLREATVFREAHRRALARAYDDFGVPAEIVVAIIGIETVFGRVRRPPLRHGATSRRSSTATPTSTCCGWRRRARPPASRCSPA